MKIIAMKSEKTYYIIKFLQLHDCLSAIGVKYSLHRQKQIFKTVDKNFEKIYTDIGTLFSTIFKILTAEG